MSHTRRCPEPLPGQGWLQEQFQGGDGGHRSTVSRVESNQEVRGQSCSVDTVFKAPGRENYSSGKGDGRLACQLLELRGAAM